MLGSSVLNPFSGKYGDTGPTGPTGATGPIGITGFGRTGNTGSYITGLTVSGGILINIFSNGFTSAASGTVRGPTGTGVVLVNITNSSVGTTFAELTDINTIKIKGICLQNNTSRSSIFFTQTANSGLLTVNTVVNSGITASNDATPGGSLKKDLAKIGDDKKYQRTLDIFYDDTNRSINLIGANFVEKAINISSNITGPYNYCLTKTNGTTMDCYINPFFGNDDSDSHGIPPAVLIIDGDGKEVSLNITNPPNSTQFGSGYISGFSLYIRNAKNPSSLSDRFKTGNVVWPNNAMPCFNVTKTNGATYSCNMLINFYGMQSVWYGSVVGITGGTGGVCTVNRLGFKDTCDARTPTVAPGPQFTPNSYKSKSVETDTIDISYLVLQDAEAQKEIYVSGTTGACCLQDGSCSTTTIENCNGYFHGPGTTCGTNNIICNLPGSCCIQYTSYNKFLYNCIDTLTCTECLGYTGMNSINIKYNGNYTECSTISCSDLFEEMGACCDGVGGCEYTDFTSCVGTNRFFQGIGITCTNNICNGGTGSCCTDSNTCVDGVGFADCVNSGGVYAGDGTVCTDYSCPQIDTCLGYIDGVRIYPGDEYGGGIVVGKYTPGKSKILGVKEYFSPEINEISYGNTYDLQMFTSFKDHTAYYSDATRTCNSDDSYVIIAYPYDVCVNGKQVLNPLQTTNSYTDTFKWSHGTTYSSWGPLIDDSGTYTDIQLYGNEYEYNSTHLAFSEGYFNGLSGATYSTGITLSEPLYNKTFLNCIIATKYGKDTVSRTFGKPVYALNGLWHNSWGLHNTIRMLSAENCNWLRLNDKNGYFKYTYFVTGPDITAPRATSLLSNSSVSTAQGITANNSALSDWYLPSHDELGFLAIHCLNEYSPYVVNFNHTLIINGYQPLSGVYWTSNGAFNFLNNEGIYGVTVEPGSLAWTMNFDPSGNMDNFVGYKYSRTDTAKVRPIRMLRCDRYYPETSDSDYNLWKKPKSKPD